MIEIIFLIPYLLEKITVFDGEKIIVTLLDGTEVEVEI